MPENKWVTGVTTPINGVVSITLLTTGMGPTLYISSHTFYTRFSRCFIGMFLGSNYQTSEGGPGCLGFVWRFDEHFCFDRQNASGIHPRKLTYQCKKRNIFKTTNRFPVPSLFRRELLVLGGEKESHEITNKKRLNTLSPFGRFREKTC